MNSSSGTPSGLRRPVVQRGVTDGAVQRGVTDGPEGRPREIQFFAFESQDALDGYVNDERRLALADERNRTVAAPRW